MKKHQEAYKKITKLINKEMKSKLKCIQIKGKINKLRSEFRKEHERITGLNGELNRNSNQNEIDGNESSLKEESSLYEKMSFLKDYISDGRKRSKRVSIAF